MDGFGVRVLHTSAALEVAKLQQTEVFCSQGPCRLPAALNRLSSSNIGTSVNCLFLDSLVTGHICVHVAKLPFRTGAGCVFLGKALRRQLDNVVVYGEHLSICLKFVLCERDVLLPCHNYH